MKCYTASPQVHLFAVGITNILALHNVLAVIQGIITFPLQIMPHASSIIRITPFEYKGERRVALEFPYDEALTAEVKQLSGARWSCGLNHWHIPESDKVIDLILRHFMGKAWVDYSAFIRKPLATQCQKTASAQQKPKAHTTQVTLFPQLLTELQTFREWLLHKRYSDSTVKTYLQVREVFLKFVSPKQATDITNEDMVQTNHQASNAALVTAQLCHPFAGVGNRPQVYSGTAGTQKQQNHRNLYPCQQK